MIPISALIENLCTKQICQKCQWRTEESFVPYLFPFWAIGMYGKHLFASLLLQLLITGILLQLLQLFIIVR